MTTLDNVMRTWAMSKATPTIELVLKKDYKKNWVFTLEEVWPEGDDEGFSSSSALDDRVEWCEKELARWSGVRRMAWDQWYFDDKVQAEKFTTLYYLLWAK